MVAMREVFGTDATTFGQFAVVDVACASLWMAILLFLANRAQQIDTRNGADTRAIDEMKARISALYENRDEWVVGQAVNAVPAIDSFLNAYRIRRV